MEEKKAKAAQQAARKEAAKKKKEAASVPSLEDQQATANAEAVQQALTRQSQASMDINSPEKGAGR